MQKVKKSFIFDRDEPKKLTDARQDFLRDILLSFKEKLGLKTVLDAGCGIGNVSNFFKELGFTVVAFDAREDNIAEAKKRYADIDFTTANIEDTEIRRLGRFDIVSCIGLLYHLENPFMAIRNLFELTNKILIIEGMRLPGRKPIMRLFEEGMQEDQGINYIAFYPTESCIIKMLYRSGFSYVYSFKTFPENESYMSTIFRQRSRTIMLASKIELIHGNIKLEKEPSSKVDPVWWTTWFYRNVIQLPWKIYYYLFKRGS